MHLPFCIASILLLSAGLFAESALSEPELPETEVPDRSFFFTAGPVLLVNTDADSAPSPIMFSFGGGVSCFQNKVVSFVSRISFFTGYYLWDGEDARPAEIENRTALVISSLVDLCGVKTWEKSCSQMQAGAGLGVLARFAALADGVSSDDSGVVDKNGTALSTAGDDVKDIQRWLWSDVRWLYPELYFSWMHRLPGSSLSAGFETRLYLPLGSLLAGHALDGALVTAACKLAL